MTSRVHWSKAPDTSLEARGRGKGRRTTRDRMSRPGASKSGAGRHLVALLMRVRIPQDFVISPRWRWMPLIKAAAAVR
jgi:hypothetical protein